jgi:TRAP-type mannitol/chloroaromatic compound transport system substrate-binding protein
MSIKTKLLQKLEEGERGVVLSDLIRLFQKTPDEKLESLLDTVKKQYDDLTKLIKENNLTMQQRRQREDAVDTGLKQIIEQLKEDTPKFIWYIAMIIGLLLFSVMAIKGFKYLDKPAKVALQRDTFQLCISSNAINLMMNEGVSEMVKEIHQATNGRLTVQIHHNTNRSEANNLLRQVSEGKNLQMFHSISYYWNQSMPASLYYASVPFGMTKEEMDVWLMQDGLRLWRALYKRDSIIPFALGHTGQQWGGWFNKEIKTVQDFNGLTMRIGGEGGKILDRLGVTTTSTVPTPASLDSFFRKDPVNKAFEWIGPYTDYTLGLHKYFKYYYQEGWHEPNTLYSLYINQAAWEKVKDIQPILENIIQKYHHHISALFEVKNDEYKQKIIQEKGSDVIQHFPCNLLKVLETKSEEHMKRYRFNHIDGYLMDSIANSYFSFHKKYKKDILFSTCK